MRPTKKTVTSIAPPKSRINAFGVKNNPCANIFNVNSTLIQITNAYSAIYNNKTAGKK
jgi:hypothetical protein